MISLLTPLYSNDFHNTFYYVAAVLSMGCFGQKSVIRKQKAVIRAEKAESSTGAQCAPFLIRNSELMYPLTGTDLKLDYG